MRASCALFFGFCYLRNPLACLSFAVTHLNTSIHKKTDFAAFFLPYFEFRRKIREIFSLLCWNRNRLDRDPVIFARPRSAQIAIVTVKFRIMIQKHVKTSGFDLKHYQIAAANFNCGLYFYWHSFGTVIGYFTSIKSM